MAKKNDQVLYNVRHNRITTNFPTETLKARRWTDVLHTLTQHIYHSRLTYPAKVPVSIDGGTKILHDNGI